MIRYHVPERIGIPHGPESAFGLVPSFRNFRLFADVQSFANGPETPICWYADDRRFTTWSNQVGVGDCIEERHDGERGSVVAYGNGVTAIPGWRTREGWVRKVLPAHLQDEAVGKLPALSFARMMEVDAFVTESEAILRLRGHGGDHKFPTVVSPEEALALVGLYRRFRRDYSYRLGSGADVSIGRLGYDALASEVALPSIQLLRHHGHTVALRLARALYARDQIHQCYFNPKEQVLGDEAFFFLDAFLVSLVAAFDAMARDIHLTLTFAGTERSVDWGGRWRKEQLKEGHPALYELTRKNAMTGAAMTLCSILRNYVHGTPLAPVDFEDVKERRRTLALHIPESERDEVYNAMQILGGDWEILVRNRDLMVVDVPTLVERLLGNCLQALKELILALHPNGAPPPVPAAVRHLPEKLQPRVVEACISLLGLD